MKTYSFSEARQKLSEVLDQARDEDGIITRRGGEVFVVRRRQLPRSPLDIPVVKTSQAITTADIVEAVRESRERSLWFEEPASPARVKKRAAKRGRKTAR
jgi:antitoxin (DNA-binding transcriptional repressor) of toxin-antitoxin stability system